MDEARLVQIAVAQGLVSTSQVQTAEHERQQRADRGVDISTWELLQNLGYLSEEVARRLRKESSSPNVSALEIEGYVIQGRLGAGGMGDVFRGRNAHNQEVAVKLLNHKYQGNTEYIRRFEREARASMRLRHLHICRTLGSGEVNGARYLLMELVEGPSLKARITDQGPISEREAVVLLEQMAAALGEAWRHGVLHRDVKPANIILGPPRPGVDEPFCAKLIDFGLAKITQDGEEPGDDSAGGLTGAGLALGTPHYMSPEQASGQPDLDQRCDIYGLGASLYHALMGHTMYSGKSSAVIMYKQVTEQIDLSEMRKKGARKQLVELLERMLAKERHRRLPTWEAVLAAGLKVKTLLSAGLGTAPTAAASAAAPTPRVSAAISAAVAKKKARPQPPTTPSPRSRSPHGLWLAAGVAVLLAAGIGGWMAGHPDGPRGATPATIGRALIGPPGGIRPAGGGDLLILAPGSYPALRLGAAQAGLILRAETSGTTIAGLTADPGLSLEVIGIDFAAPVNVTAGAKVTITGGHLAGAEISGGRLELHASHVVNRVRVGRQGTLTVSGGRFDAGLEIEDSTAEIDDLALDGGLQATRSTLRLHTATVRAGHATAAISLDRAPQVELDDVDIQGGTTGILAVGSRLPVVRKLTLTAQDTGISWLGPVEPAWTWSAVTIHAPTPATGIPATLWAPPAPP